MNDDDDLNLNLQTAMNSEAKHEPSPQLSQEHHMKSKK